MNTYAHIKCISLMTNLFIIFMFLIVLNEIKGQFFVYGMHFIALTLTNDLFIWLQFTALGICTHCIFLNINCFKDTECIENTVSRQAHTAHSHWRLLMLAWMVGDFNILRNLRDFTLQLVLRYQFCWCGRLLPLIVPNLSIPQKNKKWSQTERWPQDVVPSALLRQCSQFSSLFLWSSVLG